MEVQRNYDGDQCAACHQCNYEVQYADQSSSLGVLVKDEFTLRFSNGSLAKLNAIFGYNFFSLSLCCIGYPSSSFNVNIIKFSYLFDYKVCL